MNEAFDGSPPRGVGVGSVALALMGGVVNADTVGEDIVGAAAVGGAGGAGIGFVVSGRLGVVPESFVSSETGVRSDVTKSMG